MKSLPSDPFRIRIIQIIADQRIADVFHMNPDLVGASRLQPQSDQTVAIGFLFQAVMGHCRLSMSKIHLPLNNRAWLADQRSIDGALTGPDRSPDNGQVFPADCLFLRHCG